MNNHTPPEQTVTDLAHLAWCALIALRLVQRDGQALSPLMAHTFLLRWLATAQKQRRFPRSVAPDIESLLRLGRQKGPAAEIPVGIVLITGFSPVRFVSPDVCH